LCLVLGFALHLSQLTAVGSYALSGALTNHIAIYMLFEKIPGFYGSGVIQLRFNEFKSAIKNLMMKEFFNNEQMSQFVESESDRHIDAFDLVSLVERINFDLVFENIATGIMSSQLGGMLNMFGGRELLDSFKPQFIEKLKHGLLTDDIKNTVKE